MATADEGQQQQHHQHLTDSVGPDTSYWATDNKTEMKDFSLTGHTAYFILFYLLLQSNKQNDKMINGQSRIQNQNVCSESLTIDKSGHSGNSHSSRLLGPS